MRPLPTSFARSRAGASLYHLARCGLALAFLAAGAVKLARPEVFVVTLRALGLVPDGLVGPLSILLPGLEIAAAVLLLRDVRGSLALIAALLAVFVAVLAYALRMGLDIDCGCYGPGDPEREAFSSLRGALWRDGAMLGAVAVVYWLRRARGWRGRTLADFVRTNLPKES